MTQSVIYQDLSKSIERELAKILGKITHHVHPEIVEYIARGNDSFRSVFLGFCHERLDVSSFFYTDSDCVFPGVRRPVNSEKYDKWKNNIFEPDGTILNDNTFPRHIWAFLSMGAAYSGGSSGLWSRSGLNKFELAHIFGHKQDERHTEKKVFDDFQEGIQPYGLFTSASNVVLIPKGFAKPTDHMQNIKVCFYKRHLDLYGSNVIGVSNLKDSCIPDWYDEIEWLEPILVSGWKDKISDLLNYREDHLRKKYGNKGKDIEGLNNEPSKELSSLENDAFLLPIALDPEDPEIFKRELLISKRAIIETVYSDGRVEIKNWNASKFSESSNLLGNLRSRPEYRSGNWRKIGIKQVNVIVKTTV
ncbi:hypothetical protein Dalk_2697 [Desulfatibacillum aliphaticivorans]|uniref:Uncharacterized protein n=1 Tax=Desulfatibacillum aliphaticivorans TaxID=218208 RepID=B8FIZ8_DESAL|nr:hypothetical protein [Desulfatibacillum aliphaticivorans]ACL04389.1 hypothetical protein Dalk_2697 [Desulfatibacillum aliphaticivorans]